MVHQMRGAFRHAPPPATGTDRPRLAGERQQVLVPAALALEAGEPAREEAAPQEPIELRTWPFLHGHSPTGIADSAGRLAWPWT